jgi:hypothetical protein
MAARKRKKAKKKTSKTTRAAKSKRTQAKKSKAKRPAKRGAAKARKSAKKTAKAAKATAKKARKIPARKKKTAGEGDYAASRKFLKDQSSFVEKNKAQIAAMGEAAEKDLEGPEGNALRDAEARAAARSRDTF